MGKGSRNKENARIRRHRQSSPEHDAEPHISEGFIYSPPTHLPTPLPEEERSTLTPSMRQPSPGVDLNADADDYDRRQFSNLIDFDNDSNLGSPHQPLVSISDDTSTTQSRHLDIDTGQDLDLHYEEAEAEDMEGTYRGSYRSPPFRVADLPLEQPPPDSSPPPIPVPPRVSRRPSEVQEARFGAPTGFVGVGDVVDDTASDHVAGHSREPNFNFTRSPTLLSPISPIYTSTTSSPYPQSQYGHSRTPSNNSYGSAHSPTLPSASSALENLTKTIRGYVPSSIPSGLPSQPSVSRGVGFGFFSPPESKQSPQQARRVVSQPQEYERDYERYDDDEESVYNYGTAGGYRPTLSRHPHPQPAQRRDSPSQQHQRQRSEPQAVYTPVTHHPQPVHPPMNVHALSSGQPVVSPGTPNATITRRSGLAQALRGAAHANERLVHGHGPGPNSTQDPVTFARWDVLSDRRLLILGYATGFQIWDCTNLGSIDEVLNLHFSSPLFGQQGAGWKSEGGGWLNPVHIAAVPSPSRQAIAQSGGDPFAALRPMIGILLESSDPDEREHEPRSTFVLLSLRDIQDQIVKRLSFDGLPATFASNEHFIVVSTLTPPTLHILSSTTFTTLHTISSASLASFAPPAFNSSPGSALQPSAISISISNALSSASNKSVSLVGNSLDVLGGGTAGSVGGSSDGKEDVPSPPAPRPVFALSGRLLTYASPPPSVFVSHSSRSGLSAGPTGGNRRLSSSSAASGSGHSVHSSNASTSVSSSPFGSLGGLGNLSKITQADVGHAALKVGESVFSGVKFLSGMAYEAAKNKVAGGSPGSGGLSVTGRPSGGRFVSRSAPDSHTSVEEEAEKRLRERERRHSNTASPLRAASGSGNAPPSHSTTVAPVTKAAVEHGHYVTIVDLMPLLVGTTHGDRRGGPPASRPTVIDEFLASRSQQVSVLEFSSDGMSVGVGLRDGHNVKVFRIQPTPRMLVSPLRSQAVPSERTDTRSEKDDVPIDAALVKTGSIAQTYDLRRGRTQGVFEGIDWADDGRWLGIGTRNRTIHVFATNPYGGKTDLRSHLEGRVRNVDFIEAPTTTLAPIARLRGTKGTSNGDVSRTPLAFIFIPTTELSATPNLLPPVSSPTISTSPTISPSSRGKRGSNYQHVLMFDPEDGKLSLNRLTLDKKPARESGISGVAASVQALGVTSISLPLPGMAGYAKPSTSPSHKPVSIGGKAAEQPMDLVVKESRVVAEYDLRRDRDSKDFWRALKVGPRRQSSAGGDWLAEAELSTCSSSQRVVPRSLYLSHQFSFHTLGEDYHALIRSYQFHIVGAKIDVRKTVEISAYTSSIPGDNGTFVEGFSAPRDIHRAPSSFDEPIASAISGSFDSSNVPPILPMYPNGIPGSNPKSLRQSIPIRAMADGVSEGFGRIRREMHRVRSPQLNPRSDSVMSVSVPLEFDEEDEDFLNANPPDQLSDISQDASRAVPLNSIQSTQQLLEADVIGTVDEEMFDGWDRADRQAIDEAEQFDDLGTAGYLAQEHERQHTASALPVPSSAGIPAAKKGKKRRGI